MGITTHSGQILSVHTQPCPCDVCRVLNLQTEVARRNSEIEDLSKGNKFLAKLLKDRDAEVVRLEDVIKKAVQDIVCHREMPMVLQDLRATYLENK